jgi:transposase InsO family protein
MRQNGLRGVQRRSFHPKTTDSQHEYPISPNRIQDQPKVTEPNQVWVTDITYIPTDEGWCYLAGVMDLGTRTLKGWSLSDSLKSKVVTDAFCQAVFRYRPPAGLIVHSDRGSQYAGREFRRLLDQHHALSSMSRKGNCYDNAAMESFWATLKAELGLRKPFKTREHARLAIFDYIETFYNRRRSHSAIGYLAPLDFEARFDPKNTSPLLSANSG